MKRGLGILLCLLLLGAQAAFGAEGRSMNIDLVLLVDSSLSMELALGGAKNYLSSELLEPLLLPGDRLLIESFFGEVERVFAGTIRNEADKARALAALELIEATGRFTDIGSALDRAEADVLELASPERPKYVLMATDERQEAPVGTKYYSPDYRLRHPALSYVKKLDFGAWRLITVGFGVEEKVEAAAAAFDLLSEAPRRQSEDFPPLPDETPPGLEGAAAASPAAGTLASDSPTGLPEASGKGGSAAPRDRAAGKPDLLPILIGIGLLAAALSLALVLRAKRSREKERHEA